MPVGWGEPAQGWQLGVRIGEELPAGQPIEVTVLLKNVAVDIQTVHETSRWANQVEVTGARGALPLTELARNCYFNVGEGKYIPTEVLPGDTYECTLSLHEMFSGLRKGSYRLQASRELYASETESLRLRSAVVEFRLVSPKRRRQRPSA
jgi:hypothetical protein